MVYAVVPLDIKQRVTRSVNLFKWGHGFVQTILSVPQPSTILNVSRAYVNVLLAINRGQTELFAHFVM